MEQKNSNDNKKYSLCKNNTLRKVTVDLLERLQVNYLKYAQ